MKEIKTYIQDFKKYKNSQEFSYNILNSIKKCEDHNKNKIKVQILLELYPEALQSNLNQIIQELSRLVEQAQKNNIYVDFKEHYSLIFKHDRLVADVRIPSLEELKKKDINYYLFSLYNYKKFLYYWVLKEFEKAQL